MHRSGYLLLSPQHCRQTISQRAIRKPGLNPSLTLPLARTVFSRSLSLSGGRAEQSWAALASSLSHSSGKIRAIADRCIHTRAKRALEMYMRGVSDWIRYIPAERDILRALEYWSAQMPNLEVLHTDMLFGS